ncbi:MAG: (d)CMP kinase [Rhodospirillum sp.]|nr:(d)CMP kinase [Rhodospirillum sp.]MCF8490469.1 (d)CMP kinase [Rhodospirillum sp.]MCF8500834.1 (d)CMP kinase [Rhodospirillum sp.]
MIIAIDGPAASGKGTLSRRLAGRLGYAHLDTGKLYRAVGMAVVRAGGDPTDPETAETAARALDTATLGDPVLTTDEAGIAASKVAAIPGVRAALLDLQRAFASRPPNGCRGAVLDGRDIGTVVCPDADAKFFVTASVETRANRRLLELRANGLDAKEEDVLRDMKERDARDSGRSVAPMAQAADAVVLDTSNMNAEQALDAALAVLAEKTVGSRS